MSRAPTSSSPPTGGTALSTAWTLDNDPYRYAIRGQHLLLAVALLLLSSGWAHAQGHGTPQHSIVDILIKWTPGLFDGFLMNILISVVAMALGTVIGFLVGIVRLSKSRSLLILANAVTQFCRNVPSIVLLFYLVNLLPAELSLGGLALPIPGWFKVTLGLTVPVVGFMSDNVYGAISGLPRGQWEAGSALAMDDGQVLRQVVIPQCSKVIVPPWMGYFAIIIMASSTASMVGVTEILSEANIAREAEAWPPMTIPMYLYVLVWFFAFCYPISKVTQKLQQQFE